MALLTLPLSPVSWNVLWLHPPMHLCTRWVSGMDQVRSWTDKI